MPTKKVLTDIPEEDVQEVMDDFKSEGCEVKKEKQANGLWTVRATCPGQKP